MGEIYQCLKVLWVFNIHDSIFFNIKCSLPGSSNWNSDLNQVADMISQMSIFSLQCGHFSLHVFECLFKCQLVWNSLPHLWHAVCCGLLPLQPSLIWHFRESLWSNSLEQVGHCYNLAVLHFVFLCLLRLHLCLNVLLQESQTNSLSCSAVEPSCTLSSCSLSLQLFIHGVYHNLYNLDFI